MRRLPLLPLFLLVCLSAAASPKQDLDALLAAEWERGLRANPVSAAYYGDFRFNDRLPDLRPEAIESGRRATRDALTALRAIDREALAPGDRLNHDVFAWQLEQSISEQAFHPERIPLDHMSGIQTFDEVLQLLRFETEADYRSWLTRLRGFGDYMDQTIALMQAGIEAGQVPPRVVMQRASAQIDGQLVASPEASRFYSPFKQFPDSLPADRREALREEARVAIAEVVLPAYRRFKTFFDDTYLPACRETVGASALPDGAALYAQRAAYFTTTDLKPEAIHAIGLIEVARIRAEMEAVRAEVGFEGDLAAFFSHLRSDPTFFHSSPEALLDGYRVIAKRIDPELLRVFNVATMPRMPYGVLPIPDAFAPNTTTAYYQGAALDGSRAGYHYVNLYKPETRPKWEMMALSLHEAVPGHHYQFAYAMELPERPTLLRTAYIVAYSEGWGLYAERLGYEMGLYADPYDRFGQLTYDMWRAVRLVVDTGLHAKGWSRQQAIDYFMANAPKSEQDIGNEIDRYIVWPGQALAYKIGQMKISELRERASKALGERFSLKDFHDVVLGTGSVPLNVLETQVDGWIATRQAAQ